MKTALILFILVPFGILAQRNIGSEFHLSGNHPLVQRIGATFFGGGIGGNVIFRDSNTVSFKTGLEINYFHTWATLQTLSFKSGDYHTLVLSIPLMARFSFGNKKKGFFEVGTYVGIGSGKSDNSYSNYTQYESYSPGIVIAPAAGFGGHIRLSPKVDLFIKPEFALNLMDFYNRSFENAYLYVRFCVGIHL